VTRRLLHVLQLWGVPSLLVANALVQIHLVHCRNLSSWKGGGFGMFSTVDRPQDRTLATEGVTQQGQIVWIDLSEFRPRIDARFLTIRRDGELNALADRLLQSDYRPLTRTRARVSTPPVGEPLASEHDAHRSNWLAPVVAPMSAVEPLTRLRWVRLRLWGLAYDSSTGRLQRTLLGPSTERGSRP
jgi:hypothetical protein